MKSISRLRIIYDLKSNCLDLAPVRLVLNFAFNLYYSFTIVNHKFILFHLCLMRDFCLRRCLNEITCNQLLRYPHNRFLLKWIFSNFDDYSVSRKCSHSTHPTSFYSTRWCPKCSYFIIRCRSPNRSSGFGSPYNLLHSPMPLDLIRWFLHCCTPILVDT